MSVHQNTVFLVVLSFFLYTVFFFPTLCFCQCWAIISRVSHVQRFKSADVTSTWQLSHGRYAGGKLQARSTTKVRLSPASDVREYVWPTVNCFPDLLRKHMCTRTCGASYFWNVENELRDYIKICRLLCSVSGGGGGMFCRLGLCLGLK
jgi:hypothetical protein